MKKKLFILLLALALCLSLCACSEETEESIPSESIAATQPSETETASSESTELPEVEGQTEPTEEIQLTHVEDVSINIGYGMEISDIGDYTGIYMEDGSDELVSGVLMCVVTNTGESTIQFAKFQLLCGEETADFEISSLPPGQSLVALEKNRKSYQPDQTYSAVIAEDAALFADEPNLQEDLVKIQMLDGIINVTNISEEDITGDVVVYYKNASSDLLYGGITYRVRIEGGIPAGVIRQMPAGHMTDSGTKILFVTVG